MANHELAIGVVSDRSDPERLGRVKVQLQPYEGIESDWLPVLVPYGGSGGGAHGHQWIPEVGDTVVVGFLRGHPDGGLVLGSVYSRRQPPPSPVKVDERVFRSRGGHHIVISDEEGSERIEIRTRSGQHVTIDEPSGSIRAKANVSAEVEAGKSVSIEAGQEVTVKAGKSVSVEAGQEVTIKAGASVTVTATSVKVQAASAVVESPSIELGGAGAIEPAILGIKFLELFMSHQHTGVSSGRSTSGPPKPDDKLLQSLSKITRLKA